MGAAHDVSVKDLKDELEQRTAALVRKVARLCERDDAAAKQLRELFYDGVADVEAVSIRNLPRNVGTFMVDGSTLLVSEEATAKLLYAVVDDLRGSGTGAPQIDVVDLMERVFGTFVLHELCHRTQGVESYPVVGELKVAAGASAMAELDAIADRDAAFAYAMVHAAGETRADFLCAFREALFLSSGYYFRVFPISGARPDKVARALGVLLMTARLAVVDLDGEVDEDPKLPLDAPLVAHLSTDMSRLAIFRSEPRRRLIEVAKDEGGEISRLVADMDAGLFDSALRRCIELLRRLGIIR